MKKFIGILLVCLMLVGLMAACGEGDNTGNGSTPTTSSQSGGNQNNGESSSSSQAAHTCKGTGEWFMDLNKHWRFCSCGKKVDDKSHTVQKNACTRCSVGFVYGFEGDTTLIVYDDFNNPSYKLHYNAEYVMDEESRYTYEYSADGIILTERMTVNDVLAYEITNNEFGDITSKKTYNADGEMTSHDTWEYTYSAEGVMESEKAYEENELVYECYYAIADGKEYMAEYVAWDADGGKVKTTYYANGDISGMITYDTEGNATETLGYVYEYDADGNRTQETCTKNGEVSYISNFALDIGYGIWYMSQKVVYAEDGACYTTTYDVNGRMVTATGVDANGQAIDHSQKFDAEACAGLIGTWEGTVIMTGSDLGVPEYDHMQVTSQYTITIDANGNIVTHYKMNQVEYMALLVEVYTEVILDQLRSQFGDEVTKVQLEAAFEASYGMSIRQYIKDELNKDPAFESELDQTVSEKFFVSEGKMYRCANWSAMPVEVEFTLEGDTLTMKDNGKDIVLTRAS